MAAVGRFFGKFFGRTIGDAASFAIGGSISRTIDPVLQQVENEAWRAAVASGATRPVDAGTAAAIVAENVENEPWGEDQAAQGGIGSDQFAALLGEARNAPDLGTLYRSWRRGEISDDYFTHGLRKAKLEPRWDEALGKLKTERLDPAVIARAIQRGIMDAPFRLPYTPPGSGGRIPSFPTSPLPTEAESLASGIDAERLFVETALVGNPPGPESLYRAKFRGAIDETDVARGLAEGNARQEWAPAFEADARAIPSVTNYVEARVRGWITPEQMNEGIARHGMTADDGQLEFLIHGRPLSWHQVFIGQRRGGVYDGPTAGIDPPFLKALQESNIRPEWYSIAWAQRYNYPSSFVLRALTQDHDVTQAEAEKILLYEGWEPELAKTVSAKWAGSGAAAKADPAIKTAQTKFLTALHKAFVGGAITEAQGVEQLALSGLSADSQTGVLGYWRKEKTLEAIKPPAA